MNREINYEIASFPVESSPMALTPAQEAQKQIQYVIMKKLSDMWTPPPGKDCSKISKEIHRVASVISRYKLWDSMWLSGRHAEKIQTWENRLKKMKEEHQKYCVKK